MAKQEETNELQTKESLIQIAEYFDRISKQVRRHADEVGDSKIRVASQPTFLRGIGYIEGWMGHLARAALVSPFGESAYDEEMPKSTPTTAKEAEKKSAPKRKISKTEFGETIEKEIGDLNLSDPAAAKPSKKSRKKAE